MKQPTRCISAAALAAISFLTWIAPAPAHAQLTYTGVNLSGGDFGDKNFPGNFGTDYTYPTTDEMDYFIGKGMNVFRIGFRWERVQQSLNAPLDAREMGRIDPLVSHATSKGAYVLLDPHNYARYRQGSQEKLVGKDIPNSVFADLWSRLAEKYKSNDHVIFALMNEPHDMNTNQWVHAANAAIAAIRATGAKNLILVPGNRWTGGWHWSMTDKGGRPNTTAMLDIVDPGNNFGFDVHQYFDNDSSGTKPNIANNDPQIGVKRLKELTDWLHKNHRRAFLGEFAVANSLIGPAPNQIGDEVLKNLMDYLNANSDVWLGWTWWSAGPWWGDYMFTLEPDKGMDRPAMTVLKPYLAGGAKTPLKQ